MATTNRNFKVKNGLDVNSNATIDSSGNANLVGATFTGNVAGTNGSFSGNVTATSFSVPGLTRTNLVINPNFETNTTNWSVPYGSLSRVTTTPQTGTYCLQVDADGESYLNAYYFKSNSLSIGTSYRAGLWVRASGAANLQLTLSDSGSSTANTTFAATTSWQFVQTPSITAAGANVTLTIDGYPVNETIFVDSAIIETTSTYTETFFDGNTPDAGGIDYAWTGTANASTSTAAGFVGVANLLGATFTGNVAVNGTITGTVTNGTTTTAASGVGYMGMPQVNNPASPYAVTAADAGKHIYMTTSGRTITLPSNANVALPIGTTIVIVAGHSTGNTTIALTSDTLRLSVVGTTGTRTLAAYGMATLVKVAATTWFISGSGLT